MGTQNRSRGEDFRRRVALHLQTHGHPSARLAQVRTLSEGLRAPGDLTGLPAAVTVRTAVVNEFSSLLDEAESVAEWSGKPFGVAVHSRRGRELGQAYAIITLDTLAELLLLVPESAPEVSTD